MDRGLTESGSARKCRFRKGSAQAVDVRDQSDVKRVELRHSAADTAEKVARKNVVGWPPPAVASEETDNEPGESWMAVHWFFGVLSVSKLISDADNEAVVFSLEPAPGYSRTAKTETAGGGRPA
ncbi:MAG: hypothetical protein JWM11_1298 [Planctomycetaceae bacterium]|nr:hypothetical protein [Planctomycetaceae bacterium]